MLEIQQTFEKIIEEDIDEYKYVICKICGKKFEAITVTHLSKHGLTAEKYKKFFPEAKMVCERLHKIYVECGRGVQEYLRREKKAFYNPELHKRISEKARAGRIAQIVLKERGHGFYDVKVKRKGGNARYKKYGKEPYREAVKKAHATNRKNGFNIGKIRVEQMINDAPYIFEDKKFLSKGELGCYKVLREVFDNEDIVVNMFIGAKSIDFFIKSLSLFIEYHPKTIQGDWVVIPETKEEYYQRR